MRSKKDSCGLVIEVRTESKGTKVLTPQDKIDNGVFSLNLPNANGLVIVNLILTW